MYGDVAGAWLYALWTGPPDPEKNNTEDWMEKPKGELNTIHLCELEMIVFVF